jgi:hypothetical protein
MTRRLLAPLAAAVLVLGVAACGPDEPEPRKTTLIDLGSDEASDGGGGEPSDGAPDGPSDGGGDLGESTAAATDIPPPSLDDFPNMNEETPEGAAAAFQYYIAVSMWSRQVGDSESLLELHTADCAGCEQFHEEVAAIDDGQEVWSPFEIYPVSVSATESATYDHFVDYEFVTGEHSQWDPEAKERWEVSEVRYTATAGMVWESGSWKVGGLDISWEESSDG